MKEPKAQEVVADVKVSPEEASMNVIAAAELNAEQPVIVADAAVKSEELKAAPKAEKKPERKKNSSKDIAKMFSGLFFSLAFVCIGLDTRLKDIISKENRALLKSFLIAQTFNIIVTFVLACVFFGVLKQM